MTRDAHILWASATACLVALAFLVGNQLGGGTVRRLLEERHRMGVSISEIARHGGCLRVSEAGTIEAVLMKKEQQ